LPGRDSVWFSGHIGTGEVEDMEKDMLSSLNVTNTIFSSRLHPMDLQATDHYQTLFKQSDLYSGDDSLVVEVMEVLALLEVLLDTTVPRRDE
jgi:hypothetical protein